MKKPKKGGAVYVLPNIPPDASAELVIALHWRRTATLTGWCLCGARMSRPGFDHREMGHVIMRHEFDCPASDEHVEELLVEHINQGRTPISWSTYYVEPTE